MSILDHNYEPPLEAFDLASLQDRRIMADLGVFIKNYRRIYSDVNVPLGSIENNLFFTTRETQIPINNNKNNTYNRIRVPG